jgi:predicted nucleic acid-binding protein
VPSGGRASDERGVHTFEGMIVPPPELVLETSFVVDALIPSQARHPECQTFLGSIMDAESRVFFNHLLAPELWEAPYKITLKERHPKKRAADVRHDRRTLRRAKARREEIENAWREVLTLLDWVAIELSDVHRWLPQMMAYGLTSFDAVHAATSRYSGVRPLVTLDYHFSFVPERRLELYVPSNRVQACRRRRVALGRS